MLRGFVPVDLGRLRRCGDLLESDFANVMGHEDLSNFK